MSKDVKLEDEIVAAVADTVDSVVDKTEPKDDDSDAKADLYVRKIIDGVTRSIAELLKPTPAPAEDDDEPEVKRKRKPAPVAPPVKKRAFTLFG